MRVDNLGNSSIASGKYGNKPFARNPWDMHVFDGKLYVGNGDSGHNAGPVFITYYDLVTGVWGHQGEIAQEQIESFQVINGRLVIPGHDPHSDGPAFFVRGDGDGWGNYTGPKSEHIYSLAMLGGVPFAALGNGKGGPVAKLINGAWSYLPGPVSARHYSNVAFQGSLYSFGVLPFDYTKEADQVGNLPEPYNVLNWSSTEVGPDGIAIHRTDLDIKTLFPKYTSGIPGFTKSTVHKVVRLTPFGSALLAISGVAVGDHNTKYHSASLFRSLTRTQELDIKGINVGDDVPCDFVVRGERAYLLTNEQSLLAYEPGRAKILTSTDGVNWERIVQIDLETFARSFEEHEGAFYLGLGTDHATSFPAAGDILRIEV
jgi:hypothetical protein